MCMYVYNDVYIRVRVYGYIHVWLYTWMAIYMNGYTHEGCIHVWLYTCMVIYMYGHIHVHVRLCLTYCSWHNTTGWFPSNRMVMYDTKQHDTTKLPSITKQDRNGELHVSGLVFRYVWPAQKTALLDVRGKPHNYL